MASSKESSYYSPNLNQSVVPYKILTVASWPVYKFLKRQVRWSGIPIPFRIFHSILWLTQSKALAYYDPAIPLLGIHTEETRIERDTCTPMFIAALFITTRTWKQPRCPSADEWIRKLWYIYRMVYYSAIKKIHWISSNEVDETGANYTEWSKP